MEARQVGSSGDRLDASALSRRNLCKSMARRIRRAVPSLDLPAVVWFRIIINASPGFARRTPPGWLNDRPGRSRQLISVTDMPEDDSPRVPSGEGALEPRELRDDMTRAEGDTVGWN